MKKSKNYLKIIIILVIIISLIFILKNVIKKSKNGNNMTSQEIVDYILNINSYSTIIEVEINSNKNTNKYILKQEYNLENGITQEVIEPKNLEGVRISQKDNNLILENTILNLSKFFENYKGLNQNYLDLYTFINNYKENANSTFEEKNDEIIMTTENNKNKYVVKKVLYINKEASKPTKLLIEDNNQKTTAIIKYNEIELN